jgi:hypothetical protein
MFVLMTWFSLNEYAFDDLSNDVMRVSSYVQGAGNIGADYVLYKQGLALNWRNPWDNFFVGWYNRCTMVVVLSSQWIQEISNIAHTRPEATKLS